MSTTIMAGIIVAAIALIAIFIASAIRKTTKNEKVENIADEVIDKFIPIIKEELPAILENAGLELDYNTYKDKVIKIIAEIVNTKSSGDMKTINTAIAITEKVFAKIGDITIADKYIELVDKKNEEIKDDDNNIAEENQSLCNGTYSSADSDSSYGDYDEELEIDFDKEEQ